MKSAIIDRDLGFKAILKEIRNMPRSYTKVGVQAETKRKSKGGEAPSMVVVAAANEFGVPGKIPARPANKIAFDKNLPELKRLMEAEAAKITAGKRTVKESLRFIGLKHVGNVKAAINSNIQPGNAPSTAREKIRRSHVAQGKHQIAANVKTLIDTGQYRNSIRNVEVIRGLE